MTVAALSTASPLIGNVPVAPGASNPAAVNDTQPFAKLIGQPASEEKTPKGEAKAAPEPEAEGESKGSGKAEGGTPSSGDTKDDATTGETDLLAEIEAMVAAASQLGIVAPPASPIAIPTPVTLSDAAKVATPDAAPASIASAVAAKAANMQRSETFAPAPPIPAYATEAAIDPAAAPTAGNGKDIATLIATLKSAMEQQDAPALPDQPGVKPPAAAAVALPEMAPVTAPKALSADTAVEGAKTAIRIKADAPNLVAPSRVQPSADTAFVLAAATAEVAPVVMADAPAVRQDVKAAAPAKADEAITATLNILPVGSVKPAPAVSIAPAAQASVAAPPAAATLPIAEATSRDGDTALSGKPRRDTAIDDRTVDTALTAAAPLAPSTTLAADDVPAAESATATLANQSVDRQLDLARDTQWLDRLARDISQAATQQGNLKFHLNPEHLGALVVEIANSAEGTSIKMTTDNDQARAIIADAQPRLIAEVRAQGLRVAESHVDLSNQQQSSGGNAQMAGQQMADGQQRRSSEDHKPFPATPANQRDVPGDSGARDDGELYA